MTQKNRFTPAAQCDAAIARHQLLDHPFYQAWSAGTLPVPALRDYAREYGAFIRQVGSGWSAVGEDRIAKVEEGHAQVWARTFAASLDTEVAAPRVMETANLVTLSTALFADPTTALGALYAFEAQQPLTAQAKAKGLAEHYTQLPPAVGEYFRLHENDYDEPALLAGQLDALSPAEAERAIDACQRMSLALYDALSGLYAPYAEAAATC